MGLGSLPSQFSICMNSLFRSSSIYLTYSFLLLRHEQTQTTQVEYAQRVHSTAQNVSGYMKPNTPAYVRYRISKIKLLKRKCSSGLGGEILHHPRPESHVKMRNCNGGDMSRHACLRSQMSNLESSLPGAQCPLRRGYHLLRND